MPDVHLHRRLRDEQPFLNLTVAVPACDVPQHVCLALGQGIPVEVLGQVRCHLRGDPQPGPLRLGDGRSAAAEFQKLLDHPGIMGRTVTGALSHLQLARAQKMMGDEAAARKSYEDFLDLWKDADANIPVLEQARSEFAKFAST